MSLNDSHMLPDYIRSMRQMGDLLAAEDVILAEIERIIDGMYRRASLLHEELINELWLERRLEERTGAKAEVNAEAGRLLVTILLNISEVYAVDMKDIRTFINKWLPAHLKYQFVLLARYLVENKETCILYCLKLHWNIPFWGAGILFDGSWKFDGSILLAARRRYHLRAALRCFWGTVYESAVSCFGLGLSEKINLAAKVKQELSMKAGLRFCFGIGFWNTFYFDGSWKFDGSKRLNARRSIMNMEMILHMEADTGEEDIGNAKAVIQRNAWFFDGSVKMDGSRILNAVYRKEEL